MEPRQAQGWMRGSSVTSLHIQHSMGSSSSPASAAEGAAEGAAASDEEERLRARVAALEEKLGERVAEPAPAEGAAAAATVAPVVAEAFQAVLDELPELQVVDDARLGMMPDKQYVFSAGDASKGNPIYKRKYEVLGMTLRQQDTYMKVFRKAVKKAKDLESVTAVTELMKNGGGGLDKDSVKAEIEKLKKSSRLASLFFRDLLPEVLDNPIANSIAGIVASLGLVAVTVLICLCFFPPIPPDIE
mmetsp:Transcript_49314/g.142901  ORF Transcript_49314/g.142901 Transcript_49314/m.142901 type:complete len:245 (-) Transcript_49314:248-982(-)